MNKTLTVTFSDNLKSAPCNENLLLLLDDGTIHSGNKTIFKWVRSHGKAKEEQGESDVWNPLGVSATYSSETYFEFDVVGWTYLSLQNK